MVYDGKYSGFNDLVWVPTFPLPTVETLLRGTTPNTWMVDLEIGEQFLDFMLDSDASKYVGIDLSNIYPEDIVEGNHTLWEKYTCCVMGLKCSPNHAPQATLIAEEFLTFAVFFLTHTF